MNRPAAALLGIALLAALVLPGACQAAPSEEPPPASAELFGESPPASTPVPRTPAAGRAALPSPVASTVRSLPLEESERWSAKSPPAPPDTEGKPRSALGRTIRRVFAPVVSATSAVMFWDPFAAAGLYDPILRDDAGEPLRGPDGEPRKVRFPLVVVWLIVAATFFTVRLRLVNFRGFFHAIDLIRGRFTDEESPGEVTHFQALSTALSGTVGLGNISGVALAISIGGPGATFWMILAGLLGMATKFAECTLGVKYRQIDARGEVHGGPMYYLRAGLARRRLAGFSLAPLGVFLGGAWALLAVFGSMGGGNMFQANQSFLIAAEMFPFLEGQGPWFGLALALCVAAVIVGGMRGIGRVTGVLVPAMAVLYIGTCLVIIGANITRLPEVIHLILAGAFAAPAAKGGFLGVMVIGLRRAAFSNEAGVGTAAIAHSAAKTREPVAEGFVGLHEPFVDTVVICTMTALVLIFTGFHQPPPGLEGVAITTAAFGSVVSWFPYLLTVAIMLFSFSTLLSFAYYGTNCFDFLFGGLFERFAGDRKYGVWVYRVCFLMATVVGASSSVRTVMDFTDMIIFGLVITNTLGLILLSGEVHDELVSYWARLASGEIRRVDDPAPIRAAGAAPAADPGPDGAPAEDCPTPDAPPDQEDR